MSLQYQAVGWNRQKKLYLVFIIVKVVKAMNPRIVSQTRKNITLRIAAKREPPLARTFEATV
jgi:hypothetical protein